VSTGEELWNFEVVLTGTGVLALMMVIHALGMLGTTSAQYWLGARAGRNRSVVVSLGIVVVASWLIAFTHILEVMAWAGFLMWKDVVTGPRAYYLALLDYTSLGCEYELPHRWRLLEGVMAISGLMSFAWSAGVLVDVAREFHATARRRFRAETPSRVRRGAA
jgi:hypothetical protein